MDPLTGADLTGGEVSIARQSPLDPDLDLLFARHTAEMHADTPPESIHMLPREALAGPEVGFYVLRDVEGRALGMGALRVADGQAEVKSMQVLAEARGRGLSKVMLALLLAEARAAGVTQVSLETGSQPIFAPARALYARAGFRETGPFGDYVEDPNSVYMTMIL